MELTLGKSLATLKRLSVLGLREDYLKRSRPASNIPSMDEFGSIFR